MSGFLLSTGRAARAHLAAVAVIGVLSAPALAQEASKPIKWDPKTPLEEKDFKGGKPKPGKDGKTYAAETATLLEVEPGYCVNGVVKLKVNALVNPSGSTFDPKNKGNSALLEHEQGHFNIAEKHARELQKKLAALLKERCKCNMTKAESDKLEADVAAAKVAAEKAMYAEGEQYDAETNHGNPEKPEHAAAQTKWMKANAQALGIPEPADDCDKCKGADAVRKAAYDALDGERAKLQKQMLDLKLANNALEGKVQQAKTAQSEFEKPLQGKKTTKQQDTKLDQLKKDVNTAQQKLDKEKPANDTKLKELENQDNELKGKMDKLGPEKKCQDHCALPKDDSAMLTPASDSGTDFFVNACPSTTAMEFPGPPAIDQPTSYTVTFTSDGGRFCTYDDSRGVPAPIYFADDAGNPVGSGPVDVAQTPQAPGQPQIQRAPTSGGPPPTKLAERAPTPATPKEPVSETPNTPTTEAPKTPESPETPTSPPDTSVTVTTDTPPDRPTEIPDTVFVKATEAVLEGQPAGRPIHGQVVKLLPPLKPDLPSNTASRQAQDTGFDKSPVQCTTGANGECRAMIARSERSAYRLPEKSGHTPQSYRIDVNIREVSGGLLETTGRNGARDLTGAPPGTLLRGDEFRIGNRTFLRVRAYALAGVGFALREMFARDAARYEEDICRDKQPGPPLGPEPAIRTVAKELPAMSLRLSGAARRIRLSR